MPKEIRQLIQDLAARFAAADIESPRREAALLVAAALGIDLAVIYAHPERTLSDGQAAAIDRLGLSRADRVPLAYLTGRVDFCGLSFHVGPGVLIPRPDSECLVETALGCIGQHWEDPVRIMDLCAGTGCIGISLASRLRELGRASQLVLTESEPAAAAYARQNLSLHQLGDSARLVMTDLFPQDEEGKPASFHLIVANPPYIPSGQIDGLMPEVSRYEPRLALDGGSDGLAFYRRIIATAPQYLLAGGWLLFEHGFDQDEPVAGLLDASGHYERIQAMRDFGGNLRVSGGRIKPGAGAAAMQKG
jgi:release factor glutamine methyltransferase